MPAPKTNDEFLELARKSGVVDDRRLNAYLEKLRTAGTLPAEPHKLAATMVRDGVLTNFQAQNFVQGRWKRFSIGNYKVLERIGTGGMGSVYLCEHKHMRRRAAVKVLPTAKASDPASLERFYREARAVAALDHPNIVRAYDVDHEDDLHYLVMEYVDGASLQDLVREQGPLDPPRAANYVSQAALGLQHAHETASLVHRDIKPGNLVVDRNGTLKLLDLGLARFFMDEEDLLTRKYDENVLGTADYLAPEQVVDSHEVDIRADIYSLGATFYFLLTGKTPFGEGTAAQKLIWHQTRQVKPVRTVREDVPEAMEAVVSKMLAKDPGQRFQTPVEVVQALAEWAQIPVDTGNLRAGPLPQEPTAAPPVNPAIVEEELTVKPTSSVIRRSQPAAAAPSSSPSDRKAPAARTAPASPPIQRRTAQASPAPAPKVAPSSPSSTKGRESGKGQGVKLKPAPVARSTDDSSVRLGKSIADTQETRGKGDTEPSATRKRSARKMARPASGTRKRPNNQMTIYGIAGGSAVAVAVLAGFLIFWRSSGRTGIPIFSGKTWYVTTSAVPDACVKISEALRKAKPRDRIVVLDDEIEEQLDLRDAKDIIIESTAGKRVKWKYPAKNGPSGTMIHMIKAERVHIKGFDMDGSGLVKHVVQITGNSPGLTLENLKVGGSLYSGVSVRSAGGGSGSPVSLVDVEFDTQELREAGLMFRLTVSVPDPKIDDHFYIRECRFIGPANKACGYDGPALGKDFVFLSNKVQETPGSPAVQMQAPTPVRGVIERPR
jgi:serine/threonine protein kinase